MQSVLAQAISIHSLVKRETLNVVISTVTILHFNPLPRKEGDIFDQFAIFVIL